MLDANIITTQVANKAAVVLHNPIYLLYGVILIIITIIIIKFLKNVVVNSIIGAVGLLFFNFVLHIKLPFFITFVVSILFGAAGLGTMLILKFFGVV